jgi:hypothetical protein
MQIIFAPSWSYILRQALPDIVHRRKNDGFYEAQAVKFGLREHLLTPTNDQRQCAAFGNVDQKVDFVEQVSTLAVLPVVLTGSESVGGQVAKTTTRRLVISKCQLEKWVQQVRTGNVSIKIVFDTCRVQGMMDNFGRRIPVENQQASSFMVDGQIDSFGQ